MWRGLFRSCLLVAVLVATGCASGTSDGDEPPVANPACGVDARVDYARLAQFGPWDDRNYDLTAEDLEVLAPDEHELHDPIPAFFRVELRKEMPHLRKSGPAQYPRSAVQLFKARYGGLQQDKDPMQCH
jgi:hypothetical protein